MRSSGGLVTMVSLPPQDYPAVSRLTISHPFISASHGSDPAHLTYPTRRSAVTGKALQSDTFALGCEDSISFPASWAFPPVWETLDGFVERQPGRVCWLWCESVTRIFRGAVPALAAFFIAASPAMAAATIQVSTAGSDVLHCGTGGGNPDCATIQGALDVSPAADGDTIQVAAGTYTETAATNVDKSVTIDGAGVGTTTLNVPPGGGTALGTDANGNHALVFIGTPVSGATIENLTVDGNGDANPNHPFVGIDINDAAATIQDLRITNVEDTPMGGGQGAGIGLNDINDDGAARTLTVDNVTVDHYGKAGMEFNSNDTSGLTANVTNSTVTGAGPTTLLAQNGIEYLADAAGTVSVNTISGNECTRPSACGPDPFTESQGTGIVLFASGPVTVSGNTINTNDTGIVYYLSDSGTPTISDNTLSGNDFQGALLEQGTANLSGNTISGSNIGVQLASFDTVGGDTGNVVANLTGNTITNTVTGISLDDLTSTNPTFFPVLTAENNVISQNSTSGIANNVAEPQDATYNYWGCSGGPGTAGCDGPTGSSAAMVSYIPFLTSPSPAPPTISKAFGASSIPFGGSTSLTFTITNPNSGAQLTGVAFSDPLPSGLVVSAPNGLTGSCGGGTITATPGSSSVSLSGATLAASASCTFAVNVTATSSGTKNNVTGPVSSNESGAGGTASATLTVQPLPGSAPPTISKAFGASSIPLGGSTSLTFTITNPNPGAQLTGVAFSDPLPSGLVVSAPNGLTGSCGGGTITATPGSSSVSLSGATLAASASCTFAVNVTATSSGTKNNVTGPVSSNESGAGGTATATLKVIAPPTISKAFGASSIPLGGSTSLTFTITNPNSGAQLTGVAFSDPLPSGLMVSAPNGLTGSCGGGTITATPGSSSVSLSGATLAASASCTFAVNVTAKSSGTKTNVTGPVSSNESGAGSRATARLTVIGPPTISIVTPRRGAVYKFGRSVRANYSCHEASGGPGIQSCSGPVASGSRLNTSRAGRRSFTVVAKSKDGLTTVRTVRYRVRPDSRFTLTDLKLDASDGSVTFSLKLPGPGVVDVLETARKSNETTTGKSAAAAPPQVPPGRFVFARLHLNRSTGGMIGVVVNPNKRGTRLVHHHRGKVFIRLWVTYTPTGGSPNTIGRRGLLLNP